MHILLAIDLPLIHNVITLLLFITVYKGAAGAQWLNFWDGEHEIINSDPRIYRLFV